MNKNFNVLIAKMKGGRINEQLSARLENLISAVEKHGKKGELILKLTVHPSHNAEGKIDSKITCKAPEHDSWETTVFYTPEGNITFSDPKQEEMFDKVRPVSISEPKIRRAGE